MKPSSSVSELFGSKQPLTALLASYGGVLESLEAGAKPSTAFASKVERFGTDRKKQHQPGPGAYNVQANLGKQAKKNWLR